MDNKKKKKRTRKNKKTMKIKQITNNKTNKPNKTNQFKKKKKLQTTNYYTLTRLCMEYYGFSYLERFENYNFPRWRLTLKPCENTFSKTSEYGSTLPMTPKCTPWRGAVMVGVWLLGLLTKQSASFNWITTETEW